MKKIILTTLMLFTALTHAGNRVALVIGNQDYRNEALDTPINDATKVANKLKKLGFTVISVGENLDRRAILKQVRAFRKQINRNTDIALFYYAGHGAQYNNESYLIPLRASLEYDNDLPIEAVKAKDILNQIEEQNAKVNVMILDACRNLPLKRTNRSSGRGLAKMESNSSTLIAYSTKAGAIAKDKGNSGTNSPYTEVLLKYLDKPNLPLTQLFNDVSYEVYQTYQQEPWMSSSRIPRIYLTKIEDNFSTSTIQDFFPEEFRGRWAHDRSVCKIYNEGDWRFIIDSNSIDMHEGSADLLSLRKNKDGSIDAKLSMWGEGESWEETMKMIIKDNHLFIDDKYTQIKCD